ncbi:MAG TPA: DinB family protein [Trebonia sp.]
MSIPFPEPTAMAESRTEVFERYLVFFRDRLTARLRELPAGELRRSRLSSGWTPLELLKHLTHVEMRWLEWGFEGRSVPDPWGDRRDGRWYVAPEESLDDLLAALDAQARRSDAVIAAHDLDEVGQPSGRWNGAPPATLERVLFHLLQEYARHLGHLDIVCELAGTATGE